MADTSTEHRPQAQAFSPKDEVRALLDRLPDSVTLEELQYHLAVYAKTKRSEDCAEREGWIAQEEVERRLARWLTK